MDLAIKALSKLNDEKIPFIFITNGGGMTEESKADDLSKTLSMNIAPAQILLSHTPLKRLVPSFGKKQVLVMGSKKYVEVAAHYGFENIITPNEIHHQEPQVFPLRKPEKKLSKDSNVALLNEVQAALVLHDPVDWALDMQVLCDILLGETNHSHQMRQIVPLFACNSDLVYMDQFKYPRFTQGAFTRAFQCLFEKYTKTKLHIEFCGKPFPIQYRMAETMLRERVLQIHGISEGNPENIDIENIIPRRFFGIGDNPLADIKGANNAGHHWTSCLVRTGVYQGVGNDTVNPAKIVTNDIGDTIELILKNEKR